MITLERVSIRTISRVSQWLLKNGMAEPHTTQILDFWDQMDKRLKTAISLKLGAYTGALWDLHDKTTRLYVREMPLFLEKENRHLTGDFLSGYFFSHFRPGSCVGGNRSPASM